VTAVAPLLVSGPPSSGGAAVAEALLRAGLPLGGPFLPPTPRDSAGAFVDREIHDWHADLADGEANAWRAAAPRDPTAEQAAALERLLEARFDLLRPWGLRSPRLLWARRYWERRFPGARWLFVVRRPAAQAWAEAERRGRDATEPQAVARLAIAELRRWRGAARTVLEMAGEAPKRVLVLDAGRLAGAEKALDRAVRENWGVPLEPIALRSALHPFLLRRRAPAWFELLARCDPRVATAWRRLTRLAPTGEAPAGPRGPRVAVLAKHRFAPSESFIQEQLRRLPGEVHFVFQRDGAWYDRDCRPLATPLARARRALFGASPAESERARHRALARFLARRGIEVLLANFGPLARQALPACRAAGVPLVAHFHGADAHRARPEGDAAWFYGELLREAAAIVAVSSPMIERLTALGAPPRRILLNPCGVDLADFPPGDAGATEPHFLAAGRFVGKKGPVFTLLAFRRLLERAPAARLTMLGEGEMRTACVQLAAALGIAGRVDFPGAYAHGELAARLRRSRAFVQHSLRQPDGDSEGTPVALLEAAASGVPAVSTRHAGIPQAVVDGETGLLCDEGDVEAMADAMAQLALDPGLAGAMGRRAREHAAAHFAIELRLGRLAALLARVARGESPVVDDAAAAGEAVGEQPVPLTAGRK